ncbi:hypothetical protein BKA56DRAFT_661200 [Ilyonectria sp. MPI-CAGE-AT-0026]|nr:hypothetical protein BKA56DRAFT_661200 [Ilyonectria sp. MPI-CAGE-AT-0026]
MTPAESPAHRDSSPTRARIPATACATLSPLLLVLQQVLEALGSREVWAAMGAVDRIRQGLQRALGAEGSKDLGAVGLWQIRQPYRLLVPVAVTSSSLAVSAQSSVLLTPISIKVNRVKKRQYQ